MPFLLAPVIIAAGASAGITISAGVASFLASTLFAGALYGLQTLLQPDQKAKVNNGQMQVKQALPSLRGGYGISKLGGAKFIFEGPGGVLIDGLVHCAGPIDGFQDWMLNDVSAGLPPQTGEPAGAGGTNTAAPWRNAVFIESRRGTPDQLASDILLGDLGGTWTSAHRLAGLAYSVIRLARVSEKSFQKTYPNGEPALTVVARLWRVYDPRNGSTAWNANPALHILHYLTSSRGTDSVTGRPVAVGYGISISRIDMTSFAVFATLCDEPVTYKDGTVHPRYFGGGDFDLGVDQRRDVLARLLTTCDGELYQTAAGTIAIRGGRWEEPVVTIRDEHILAYDAVSQTDRLAAFNRLKITFTDPANDWQQIEGDPWDDLAAQDESGIVLTREFAAPFVQSHAQARRLAKIAMHKGNPRWKLTLTTDVYGLMALGERTVRVELAELGIATSFLVTGFAQSADGTTCKLDLSSLGPEAYAWNPAAEEGMAPANKVSTVVATVIPDVSGFALEVVQQMVGDNVTGLLVQATIADPGDETLEFFGQIRLAGSQEDWRDMSASGPWSVISGAVGLHMSYEVRVALRAGFGGSQGAFAPIQTITVETA